MPDPLTLERLHGHQVRPEDISVGEHILQAGRQFRLNEDQAEALIKTVLHLAKDAAGDDIVLELEEILPSDRVPAIEHA